MAKKLFGSGKKKKVDPAEAVMPFTDDEAVRLAKKRSIAAQMKRGGRSSTMLTTGSILR